MKAEESPVLRRKRNAYKRSQTLASLPLPVPRTETAEYTNAGWRQHWPLAGPTRGRFLMSSRASIPGGVPHETRRSLSGGNVSEMDALRSHSGRSTGNHRHGHFMTSDLCHDSSGEGMGGGRRHGSSSSSSSMTGKAAAAAGVGVSQTKRLGRTPSSPSVLLSKVKERIREKVFETSAEWPHMAAIVQERRQRAADAFEARMSLRRMRMVSGDQDTIEAALNQQQQQQRMRRVRIRSDPAHHRRTSSSGSSSSYAGSIGGGGGTSGTVGRGENSSFDKDGAKVAFRRRSISDDTYNQQRRVSCSSSRSSDRGGIVCSDDDLRAIVYEHRHRRSPIPLKHQETLTGTMDIGEEVMGDSVVFTDFPANTPLTGAIDSSSVASFGVRDRPSPSAQERTLVHYTAIDIKSPDVKGGDVSPLASSGTPQAQCEVKLDAISNEPDRHCADRKPVQPEPEDEEKAAPVPDVVFDEHGQTWDVYGAEFDPEILGQAIQSHLQKIMKRRLTDKSDCIEAGQKSEVLDPPKSYARQMTTYNAGHTQEANDHALGFFLRYLCFLARSREHVTQNS